MSVDYYSMTQDIIARVASLVHTGLGYDVVYPNQPAPRQEDALWIRASVQIGETIQASIGINPIYRTTGILFLQLFDNLEKGEKELLEGATAISALFRGVSVGMTLYRSPSVAIIGRDRNWWQVNVTCPFQHDTYKD